MPCDACFATVVAGDARFHDRRPVHRDHPARHLGHRDPTAAHQRPAPTCARSCRHQDVAYTQDARVLRHQDRHLRRLGDRDRRPDQNGQDHRDRSVHQVHVQEGRRPGVRAPHADREVAELACH